MSLELDGVERTTEEALRHIEITTLRQLGDSLHRQGLLLQEMHKQQQAMMIEFAVLKAQDVKQAMLEISNRLRIVEDVSSRVKTIEEHSERIRDLENAEQRRKGATGLIAWIGSNWPFLATIVGIIAVWLKLQPHSP